MVTAQTSVNGVRHQGSPEEHPSKKRKHVHRSFKHEVDAYQAENLGAKIQQPSREVHQKPYDESKTTVGNGISTTNGDVEMSDDSIQSAILISSDESAQSSDEDVAVQQNSNISIPRKEIQDRPRLNGTSHAAKSKTNAQELSTQEIDEEADAKFQSIYANAAQERVIDVDEELEPDDENGGRASKEIIRSGQALSVPNATTLTTVLTQALKTDDSPLLESCLGLVDLDSIRATIEKLPSPLVASLLNRLAERLHRRPGRAGNLMVWVQWALVAHGGYLAAQPDVVAMLRKLESVIRERASGLNALLSLKGRLDMLNAQLELRRGVEKRIRSAPGSQREHEAVIYVEGQESSDDDGLGGDDRADQVVEDYNAIDSASNSADGDSDEDMPNGIHSGEADSEDESDDADSEVAGLIDDEAEEDSGDDEDELSDEGLEEEEDESDSDASGEAHSVRVSKSRAR